jgi:hypothetical protein
LAPRRIASLVLLLASNAVCLAGVLFGGWSIRDMLVLFWSETAVIGAYNVLKMLLLPRPRPGNPPAPRLLLIPLFLLHFGIFMAVHLVFVLWLTRQEAHSFTLDWRSALADARDALAWGLPALVLSHGASFVSNYLVGGERRRATASELFVAPYSRIMVMHLVVMFGAAVVVFLRTPAPLVVLLAAIKVAVDVRAHLKEHATPAAGVVDLPSVCGSGPDTPGPQL